MGLCACNSAGHLSNHAEVAPNHAGITFSVSNTLVICIYCFFKFFNIFFYFITSIYYV